MCRISKLNAICGFGSEDEQGLTGLWFTEGGRYIGLGLKKEAFHRETDYFDQTKEWLDMVEGSSERKLFWNWRAMK